MISNQIYRDLNFVPACRCATCGSQRVTRLKQALRNKYGNPAFVPPTLIGA